MKAKMIKHSSFLAALTIFVPRSSAEKPVSICSNNAAPFELGGFNVPVDAYNDGIFDTQGGLEMIEDLWRRQLPGNGNCATDIHPSRSFDFIDAEPLEGDEHFAFDQYNGQYRGVGVMGAEDEEINSDEGLYVHFGGAETNELHFGVRALFWEGIPKFFEKGLINVYQNGVRLEPEHWEFEVPASFGDDDGQESFHLTSDVAFDAISFISYSHSNLIGGTGNSHSDNDYFLEYLDLCFLEFPDTCERTPKITGDPHIQTWSGMNYDFHGVCDLVLLQNPDFEKGLGMDIHVRTKQIKEFSYVSSAVLQIGDGTLEVTGDIGEILCWIDQEPITGNLDEEVIGSVSGYPISYQQTSSKQYVFLVNLGDGKAITLKTFKKFVHVSISGATKESFGSSLGLLGSYGSGKMIARDKRTVIKDANAFGQEWQVLPFEDKLFHNNEGPQAPTKCDIPQANTLRRRLVESNVSKEEAKIACARVGSDGFDMCVFDVMATGDKDVVGAY